MAQYADLKSRVMRPKRGGEDGRCVAVCCPWCGHNECSIRQLHSPAVIRREEEPPAVIPLGSYAMECNHCGTEIVVVK